MTPPSQMAARARRRPVEGVLGAIGDTPLVALRRLVPDRDIELFAKLEVANPGGSAKDRPAIAMLEDALLRGLLAPGGTVVESTSGNLGVGLAQACRYHGVRLICVVDVRASARSVRMMQALGADVRTVREPDPVTGDLLVARLDLVRELVAATPGAWWPNQYGNHACVAAHAAGTMREIDEALDGELDVLLVATSTAGTIAGCRAYLAEHDRAVELVAVDARGSALFGGRPGRRLLPGLGAGIDTALAAEAEPDRVLRVTDVDCVIGCRRLAAREGILAGASGGGVVRALERLAGELEHGARCALILPDGGAGYLDTVYDDEWVERVLGLGPDELAAHVR
jgi:N-(2-amino-2-carboxyethyl)-L-glutamate synthase